MNEWLLAAGLSSWKPLLTAFLLPPTPFLFTLLLGGWLRKPGQSALLSRLITGLSVAAIWLSSSSQPAELLARRLSRSPPALTSDRIGELRSEANGRVAIIILGGGVEDWAPEYSDSSLMHRSLERLRYGVWLARQTHWPVGFSGGVGWGQGPRGEGTAEATVAQRIASREFGLPLRWLEPNSRDTNENAINTVALLRRDGITHLLLVTHYWHMSRALRNFRRATGGRVIVDAAPMGLAVNQESTVLRWLPSGEGLTLTRQVWREQMGLWAGA